WEKDNARLATLPMQKEWEAYVAQFQGCDPDAPSTAKWTLMEKIFELDKD
ncbi:MAG: L-rhamnose mutarotase, partial [Bacteroidales bacterium]|nr:L-rhamnose mutarotase [Bacteroidales bacterium]